MTKIRDEVLAANQNYAKDFGDKAKLPVPPAAASPSSPAWTRGDPAKFAGLAEGDAHVIRNAGGRASDDAIRSLVISHKLLGTGEWFVIHHTDCGMQTFTDEVMRALLRRSLDTVQIGPEGWKNVGKGPRAPRKAISSIGLPSRTKPRASPPTSPASAPTRSSPLACPSTAISTT
jgi:carbonic anhydrase